MIIVTGGCGFIGSHIVDSLLDADNEVLVIDNLAFSDKNYLNSSANFVNLDISSTTFISELSSVIDSCDAVFHFAADPDVRRSRHNPSQCFRFNSLGTFNVLDFCRKHDCDFVFASSSSVYGIADIIPTPETAPMKPESPYASSKVCGEAYARSFSNIYGLKVSIFRYANVFGDRSLHGVIPDFFRKLRKDKSTLEILGNGYQKKSFIYVLDAVNATMMGYSKQNKKFDVFNVGSEESHTIREIASMMCDYLNVSPEFRFTSNENFGWKGDVPIMLLDISKIKKMGFSPHFSFSSGLKRYLDWLKSTLGF